MSGEEERKSLSLNHLIFSSHKCAQLENGFLQDSFRVSNVTQEARVHKLCIGVFALFPVTAVGQAVLPIVTSTAENIAATELTIDGIGFGSVKSSVTLGGTSLTVLNSSESAITAQLPAGTAPGSYLISVENNSSHLPGVFAVTLGVQGPQGVTGPQGVQGIPGLQGPAGRAGPAGPVGATGAVGAQGHVGAVGPAGALGPQGNPGVSGAAGPAWSYGSGWSSRPDGSSRPSRHGVAAYRHCAGDPRCCSYGRALASAIRGISAATATQPYVVQLDAGTYTYESFINVAAYISLHVLNQPS